MRILSLSTVPLLPYLGSGNTRLHWTSALKESGNTVDILQPKDFEIFPKLTKAKKYRLTLGVFFKALKLLRHNQYDLIEFYGDEYWLLLIWLKKIKRKSPILVAHVDGLELLDMEKEQRFWNPRHGFKRWMDKNLRIRLATITFKLADKFVCGCQDDLDYVIREKLFTQDNCMCISPGIEDAYHEIAFTNNKEKVIFFLGSWVDRKGISIIPEVISKVLNLHKDYQFHVYGAWHSKKEIASQFHESLSDRIIVFDKLPVDDLLNGILKSSIFFFPSYSEGFGLATVEAMSCSCAVVTTKTGVGSQLVNNEEALICEFDDKPGMIAAISKLTTDDNLRRKIALNGYNRSKDFKWSVQTDKLNSIYHYWVNK